MAGGSVVGVDVAAGESWLQDAEKLAAHGKALARAKAGGLRITIHAGEGAQGGSHNPAENVRRSVEDLGAERIGHGYGILEDEVLCGPFLQKHPGIHFECCPTSCIATMGWAGYAGPLTTHPAKLYLDEGFRFGISTDDPTNFATTILADYRFCEDQVGLSKEQLRKCQLDAIDAAFTSDAALKAKIRAEIEAFTC